MFYKSIEHKQRFKELLTKYESELHEEELYAFKAHTLADTKKVLLASLYLVSIDESLCKMVDEESINHSLRIEFKGTVSDNLVAQCILGFENPSQLLSTYSFSDILSNEDSPFIFQALEWACPEYLGGINKQFRGAKKNLDDPRVLEILRLRDDEGLTYKEISEKLKIHESSVKYHYSKAKQINTRNNIRNERHFVF